MNKILKLYNRFMKYFKTHGMVKTIKKILRVIFYKLFKSRKIRKFEKEEQLNYLSWIKNNEPSEIELEEQRNTKFQINPKITIIVPMYNTPQNYFEELIESIKNQTYINWELCLADGSEKKADYIDELIKDNRIKYKFLNKNGGISDNSNEALKIATGDYYALLDHDDVLPAFSLFEVVKAINKNPTADFIYSDEDKLMETVNKRMGPHFKSDYAHDTLLSYNYICHFSVFKKELMDKLGGFNSEFDGSQDYDIILRATENAKKIVHIPKILYHWRINSNSVASSSSAKPYAYIAAKKAIRAHLNRIGENAEVSDSPILGLYRIDYKLKSEDKVSIIILNKDHVQYLKKCINSIEKTKYDNYEIIVLENNSEEAETFKYYEKIKDDNKVKVIIYDKKEDFNYSKLNNYAVKSATGKYLLFLNNDVEIIYPDYEKKDWLEMALAHCQRNDVGIVGAKLLYSNNTIQHAGVVLNFGGVAGHLHCGIPENEVGYFGRIMIQQNFSAVTGAFLLISKNDFEKIGGFDEDLPISYNDIDLCLKVRKLNKLVVYNPYIIAYHYESITRGYDVSREKEKRLEEDAIILKEKWKDIFDKPDPYFNVNLRTNIAEMRVNPDKIEYKGE